MASKKRRLGRGLDALLGDTNPQAVSIEKQDLAPAEKPTGALATTTIELDRLENIPIEFLRPGKYQPRKNMQEDKLKDMAASIESQGIMQPLIVRSLGAQDFEIIAGERRWRAAQLAGLDKVPVIVRDLDDKSTLALALIENLQREDLTPLEEASALMRLRDEFALTQQEVAEAVGKSRSAVTNLLRLLNLAEEVKPYLNAGKLEMGHARALLSLDTGKQIWCAKQIIDKSLTVRQTEALVKKVQKDAEKVPVSKEADPNIKALETRLGNILGAKVAIKHTSKGTGKLQIAYSSMEELDGILDKISNKD